LDNIDYPANNFEVILLDDHSTDQSAAIVAAWQATTALHVRLLSGNSKGKKAAQLQAISLASHDYVACTDADCTVPEKWLLSINEALADNTVRLIFGPVVLKDDAGPLQSLEHVALLTSTMAMLANRWPVMGNAANMAFAKATYLQISKQSKHDEAASGDDVFLLHHVAQSGYKIATHKALVTTAAQATVGGFLQQRMRWAAKARLYRQLTTVLVGALVFSINLFLLAGIPVVLIYPKLAAWFWLAALSKALGDWILLKRSVGFYGKRLSVHYFMIQEIANLIYIPLVGVLSQLVPYTWKGRSYRSG
jgi:cellulose synthase/poly-beta-1,6-N-acetylglucosamine synthase-like glycosyltransferase